MRQAAHAIFWIDMSGGPSFFAELQRRNVYKIGAMYAVSGWLVVQIVTQVLPIFDVSALLQRIIVLAVVAGFPVALVLSWVYELTPQGIVRTDEVPAEASVTAGTGQKLNRAIIGVLSLAVLVLLAKLLWLYKAPPVAATAMASQPSIAVLPLANESGDKDQQYFSDGLSEDLINALSQSAGLRVIARGSSFRFRDSADDARSIGDKLGVAYLLEGSVRHFGEQVRISAELVSVADSSTLWSQHFDRPYGDLFKLEDEITSAVAGALKARLIGDAAGASQSDRPPGGSLEAYNAYQQGKFYQRRFNDEDSPKAIAWLEKATQLDPQYARAYAALSAAWASRAGNFLSGASAEEARAKAHALLEHALALQPDLAASLGLHANALAIEEFDWAGAEAEARRAVQLAPNDTTARALLGIVLGATGQFDEALRNLELARDGDPLNPWQYLWLQAFQSAQGHGEEAERSARKGLELEPMDGLLRYYLALQQIENNDGAGAQATVQLTPPGSWRTLNLALAAQAGADQPAADAALQKLIHEQAGFAAFQIAELYAVRKQPDAMFQWLNRAAQNHDPGIEFLLADPAFKPYHGDSRFAAFCTSVHLTPPQTGI